MVEEKIIKLKEDFMSDFQGTIIDIETIGDFDRNEQYRRFNDSRQYKNIKQVIFGFINKTGLQVFCADSQESIDELSQITISYIENLERPFYAFNSEFESGVWFHQLDKKVIFDGELNKEKFEKKADTVRLLKISNYQDPFNDIGFKCMEAWIKKDFGKAIAHNKSCLLKERDILIKRGSRKPSILLYNK